MSRTSTKREENFWQANFDAWKYATRKKLTKEFETDAEFLEFKEELFHYAVSRDKPNHMLDGKVGLLYSNYQ
jgi:hypothetical protein